MSQARDQAMPARRVSHEPAKVSPGQLAEAKPGELAIRFAFGAAVSLVAGVLSLVGGPHLGGLFLAFPAILPATLTMLGKHEGKEKADEDAWGATAGAAAMIAFAAICYVAFGHLAAPLTLLAGLIGWVVLALGLWWVLQRLVAHEGSR